MGEVLWQLQLGDGTDQEVSAVSIDQDNNIYLVGTFEGTVVLGGMPLTSAGGTDIFVARMASTGTLIWAKSFGDEEDQTGDYIDVNGTSIVIGGSYRGAPSFEGSALPYSSPSGWYVAYMSRPSGDVAWATGVNSDMQSQSLMSPLAIRINGAFVGDFSQSMGGLDALLRRVGPGGVIDDLSIRTSALAPIGGELIVAGSFSGSEAIAGGPTLASAGGFDSYVARLSSTMSHTWSVPIGGTGADFPRAVAVAADDSVYVCGRSNDDIPSPVGTVSNQGGNDWYVARISPTGALLALRGFGGPGTDECNAIAVSGGVLTTAGASEGPLTIDGTNLTGGGSYDGVIVRYNPMTLEPIWARRGGTIDQQRASGIAVDSFGRSTVGGSFREVLDFDEPLTSEGNADGFLLQLSP